MNPITRLQHRLSDRMHARGDAFAGQAGWTITRTTGRFGFGARVYRDLRFSKGRAETNRSAQPTGASR
jgi:hypothetical protein